MLRSLRRALPAARALGTQAPLAQKQRTLATRAFCTGGKNVPAQPPVDEELYEMEANLLDGKRSQENIHAAFSARAMDAIRYEYFAQRAELEAEIEAASAFRTLTETAKQQAMGYLELMEGYGDAGFGSTVENIDVAAAVERENAEEVYRKAAVVASEEDLQQAEEWFEDLMQASSKAAARLELVSSILDAEAMEGETIGDEGDDIPDSAKN